MKIFKTTKFILSIVAIVCASIFSNLSAQQNVSISDVNGVTPDASSVLDVSSTSKGLLIPRVALTATNSASPITLPATSMMVYNTATAGVSPNNVIPGYYYNAGTPTVPDWARFYAGSAAGTEWKLLGNAGTVANTNFLGTTDAIDLVFRTNNTEKVRIMSDGNVGIGTATPYAKLNVAGNGTVLSGNGIIIGTIGASLNTNVAIGAETGRFELAFAGYRDVEPNQIGAKIVSIRRNNYQANSALIQSSDLAFFTGTGSTGGNTTNFLDPTTEKMRIDFNGNVGIGTTTPAVKLAVNGSGVNYYNTDAWIENNMHVQGNETLTQGGRGRMRVGTAWNYIGLYSELSSSGVANDLVLGASSALVRVGPAAGGQNLRVSGLEGTGTRPVFADANGTLVTNVPFYNLNSSLHPSNDDITGWNTIRSTCSDDAVATFTWGFNFKINGINYTSGWISTNGVFGFGSSSSNSWTNSTLPASISNDPMCFFHWDDDGSSLQRWVVLGTSPQRICYIHSRQSEATGCSTGSSQVDVYISLHETSNVMSVRYVGIGSSADVQGAGATYGFQFSGGSSAYAVPLGTNTKLLDDNNGNQSWSIDFGK